MVNFADLQLNITIYVVVVGVLQLPEDAIRGTLALWHGIIMINYCDIYIDI